MLDRPLFDSLCEFFICESFTVCDAIVLQKVVHVVFGSLGQVSVKDNAEDIVLKFGRIHASTKVIGNAPELLGEFLRFFTNVCCHYFLPPRLE